MVNQIPNIRVGQGIDFHRFIAPGDFVVLGGVKIPHHHRLEGHSDADVLLHAIMDAILGAAGLADIGSYFPNTDEQFRGISSLKLLEKVLEIVNQKGFKVGNCDCTILAESPKVNPFREKIIESISNALGISNDRVSIKATTTESMGAIGRSEGMMATAVVLLYT